MHRICDVQKHEHIFIVSRLENSNILRNNDTKVNERTRIMARCAYANINEIIMKIKLLFPPYHNVIIVIKLVL